MSSRKIRSLKRRYETRPSKKKFIIYTEGANTEPDYFNALSHNLVGALVDVQIVGAAGVPLTIAERAVAHKKENARNNRRKSSFEKNDEIWVVFDRDEHPRIDEALAKCGGAQVGVAYSNPCFELWLILHYNDFDGAGDRHHVQAELEKLVVGYNATRGKTADWSNIVELVEAAEQRAIAMNLRRAKDGGERPYTSVHDLTMSMRAAHAAVKR